VLAEAVGIAEIFVVLIYLFVVVYLGWLGYTQTKTAADYPIAGFTATSFLWLVFVKAGEAEAIGLVKHLTGGKSSILTDYPNPIGLRSIHIIAALPISIIVIVVVSLFTKQLEHEHLDKCFS